MSHKCFISYHKVDKKAVEDFCDKFSGSFIRRGIQMEDDIIDSDNTDYVMERIRKLYLQDSTVTVVLIGKCTWARRFIDWEVQASLRQPKDEYPNGLLAVQLWESYNTLPNRVSLNVESGYAEFYKYPKSSIGLANMIDRAWNARFDNADLIENPRARFSNNRQCD